MDEKYSTEYFLGFIFGISQGTVSRYVMATLDIFYNYCLEKKIINFPNREERDKMSVFFRGIRISTIIDGSEQAIKPPVTKILEQVYYSGNLFLFIF